MSKFQKQFRIHSENELDLVVDALISKVQPGDWIRLEGDLGAGKTTFVRRFLRKVGWQEAVPSPTYPLLVEYEVNDRKYIHIDGFRLDEKHADPWDSSDWKDAVVFVEWAEKTKLSQKNFRWSIELRRFDDEERMSEREIKLEQL